MPVEGRKFLKYCHFHQKETHRLRHKGPLKPSCFTLLPCDPSIFPIHGFKRFEALFRTEVGIIICDQLIRGFRHVNAGSELVGFCSDLSRYSGSFCSDVC